MATRWLQKNGRSKQADKRSRNSGKRKQSRISKQKKVSVFRKYTEKPEEVAAYTNNKINLDPNPENQKARIEKLSLDLEALEKDLAPLTEDEKEGMRKILEE